jgi:two-component system, NtrC family, response regulator AtoC
VTVAIPPLRERVDEIEPLVHRFLGDLARQAKRPAPSVSAEAMQLLRAYPWPGNVRELRNVVERASLLCGSTVIAPEHLQLDRRPKATIAPPADAAPTTLRDLERQAIVDALARCAGNQSRAAELLGMSRRTFCTRLRELGIPRPRV